MAFNVVWTPEALEQYNPLKKEAQASLQTRRTSKKAKATPSEGLFKQVHNGIQKLLANPRHPGLNTHKFSSIEHPCDPKQSVFVAYAQNNTPGAYRIFWCYGPKKTDLTLLTITPHP